MTRSTRKPQKPRDWTRPTRTPNAPAPADKRPASPDEWYTLKAALRAAGRTDHDALALFGVHRRTLERWRRGEARIPPAVLLAARLLCGDLGAHSTAFAGFQIRGDCIITDTGEAVSVGQLRGAPWMFRMSFSRPGARPDKKN